MSKNLLCNDNGKDIFVNLTVADKPIALGMFCMVAADEASIEIFGNVANIILETTSVVTDHDKPSKSYSSRLFDERTVDLVMVTSSTMRAFHIPVTYDDVEKIDKSLTDLRGLGNGIFIITTASRLVTNDDHRPLGLHTTNTNWPVSEMNFHWVKIDRTSTVDPE